MIRNLTAGLAVLAALTVAAAPPAEARRSSKRGARLRAMTFNIRYDFESDGPNRWAHRVDAVAEAIRASGAHVVCLQEDKEEQVTDLQARLPEHGFVGRGRNASGSGERCSILYDRSVLRLEDSGDFWLSDTPDVPGSNTWGDRYPRKATWALLEVKKAKTALLVVNTHLPEGDSDRLRIKGVEVIRAWLAAHFGSSDRRGRRSSRQVALLVTGDFNDDAAGSRTFSTLTEGGPTLRDAWEEAGPQDRSPGTYGGFRGLRTTSRIDWLLVGGPVRVLQAAKLDEQVDGRWPSDHYPVLADLQLR